MESVISFIFFQTFSLTKDLYYVILYSFLKKERFNVSKLIKLSLVGLFLSVMTAGNAQASFLGLDSIGTVNGSEISKSKFENGFKNLQAAYKTKLNVDLSKPENASTANKLKSDVLKSVIKYTLIINEANTRGLKVSDDEVNKQFDFIKDQYKAQGQDFNKALKDQGLTEKDLKAQLKDNMLMQKLEKAFYDEESVSKAEIEKFYNKPENAQYFNHGELAHAAHILILADEKKLSASEMKAKKELAQSLLNKVLKGEDFANLAINNSEDPGSKTQGGDLGYFAKGKMVPEFEKACFEGKVGAVYPELVKTTYGFHIIKVLDKKPAGKLPLDEDLSKQIANAIKVNKTKEDVDLWVKGAYSKAKIDLKPEYKQLLTSNP